MSLLLFSLFKLFVPIQKCERYGKYKILRAKCKTTYLDNLEIILNLYLRQQEVFIIQEILGKLPDELHGKFVCKLEFTLNPLVPALNKIICAGQPIERSEIDIEIIRS